MGVPHQHSIQLSTCVSTTERVGLQTSLPRLLYTVKRMPKTSLPSSSFSFSAPSLCLPNPEFSPYVLSPYIFYKSLPKRDTYAYNDDDDVLSNISPHTYCWVVFQRRKIISPAAFSPLLPLFLEPLTHIIWLSIHGNNIGCMLLLAIQRRDEKLPLDSLVLLLSFLAFIMIIIIKSHPLIWSHAKCHGVGRASMLMMEMINPVKIFKRRRTV